jgi:hypothetical protein
MTNRINARLDDELAAALERVRRRTKKSTTEMVRESLALYCQRFAAAAGDAAQIFDEHGFIGCGEGTRDLSSTYKRSLADSLAAKTGA